MVNYQLGKIYELVCNTTGSRYIGSTCYKYLSQRLQGHKEKYREWKKGKRRYCSSFSIIENGNYTIELIEKFPCNCNDELRAREGYYQRNRICVNKRIECHSIKEWNDKNKDKLVAKKKKYRSIKFECECGSKMNKDCKTRHLMSKKHKDYLLNNK